MNIGPNKVFTGRRADGSKFRINEWDATTLYGYDIFSGFIQLCLGIVFSAFSPIIFMVITILYFNGRRNMTYIIGALISGYVLLDAYNGWLVTRILDLCLDKDVINFLVCINTGCLIAWVILFIIGPELHTSCSNAGSVNGAWVMFIIYMSIFIGLGYFFGYEVVTKYPDWLVTNLGVGLNS